MTGEQVTAREGEGERTGKRNREKEVKEKERKRKKKEWRKECSRILLCCIICKSEN